MWGDSFVFQLLLFVAAQFAAWTNLLRGRPTLGFAQFALLCVLADALLVARLVYQDAEPWSTYFLWGFQGLALLTLLEFAYRVFNHKTARARARRDDAYADAFANWLAGSTNDALETLRRLARNPWDFESALLLATVLNESGHPRQSRRWLLRARRRTNDPRRHEEIDEELRRVLPLVKSTKATPTRDASDAKTTPRVRDARVKRAG